MRAVGGVSGLLVVAVLGTALFAVFQRQGDGTRLAASRQQTAVLIDVAGARQADPPHVVLLPSPSPSPAPTNKPPAPSSGGGSAPARTARPSIVVRSTQQSL